MTDLVDDLERQAATSTRPASARCWATSPPASPSSRPWTATSPVGLAVAVLHLAVARPAAGARSARPRRRRRGRSIRDGRRVLRQHPGRGPGGVCRTFAASGADKFAGVGWKPGRDRRARCSTTCWRGSTARIEAEHDAGDHNIVHRPRPRPRRRARGQARCSSTGRLRALRAVVAAAAAASRPPCPSSSSRTRSPASSSSRPTSTATSAAASSRPTDGRGSRPAARWSRPTAPTSRRARSSGCTTTSARPTTGASSRAGPGSCCTTCARARRPSGATLSLELDDDDRAGRLHPARGRPRLRRPHRRHPHVPGRQLLRPGRRARRGMGRPRHRRRLGRGRPGLSAGTSANPAGDRPILCRETPAGERQPGHTPAEAGRSSNAGSQVRLGEGSLGVTLRTCMQVGGSTERIDGNSSPLSQCRRCSLETHRPTWRWHGSGARQSRLPHARPSLLRAVPDLDWSSGCRHRATRSQFGLPGPRPRTGVPTLPGRSCLDGACCRLACSCRCSAPAARPTCSTGRARSTSSLDDVKGAGVVVEEVVKTLNLFLAHKTFKERMGGTPRRAILFEGPPGTGKTYMAKAMAREAGVPFLFVSSSAFQSMYYGQTNRKIRAYFKALRKAPGAEGGAIGFIEEIDAIGAARSRHGRRRRHARASPASSTSCSSSCSPSTRRPRGDRVPGLVHRPASTAGCPPSTSCASREPSPPTSS